MSLFDILKRKKKTDDKKIPEKTSEVLNVATPKKATSKLQEKKIKKEKKSEKALKPGTHRIDESAKDGEYVASIIYAPRITEKASYVTADGGYTFNVSPRANKVQIKRAIKEIYGVNPIKVNIITIPSKKVIIRNKRGVKSGGKKAIVYLKDGDRIEFV